MKALLFVLLLLSCTNKNTEYDDSSQNKFTEMQDKSINLNIDMQIKDSMIENEIGSLSPFPSNSILQATEKQKNSKFKLTSRISIGIQDSQNQHYLLKSVITH
jgi:hypothetical protein